MSIDLSTGEIFVERSIEHFLHAWKKSTLCYPLLLRGARQVGKSYVVEKFGREAFESLVTINFEAQPEAWACFDSLHPEQILLRLQLIQPQKIIPGKTLLFLDEIQASPQALRALRYFKEKLPDLHVIGAGSLLEFSLRDEAISVPVGRVQFAYLGPLSFREYLSARGHEDLLEELAKAGFDTPLAQPSHLQLLRLIKEYAVVGGMPATVEHFRSTLSLREVGQIQDILLSTYRADFSKYASPSEQRHLRVLMDGIFPTVGQQFKYSKVDPHLRSRELKQALDHLEAAGLVQPVYASTASCLPLSYQVKLNQFKLLFLDLGLLQRGLGVDAQKALEQDLLQLNRGALAEQLVGQELLAYSDCTSDSKLFFWKRDKAGSAAEVDYLAVVDGTIVPIEVKAGVSSKLKSMREFLKEKNARLGIRVSEAPLELKDNILSIPLYRIADIQNLARDALARLPS